MVAEFAGHTAQGSTTENTLLCVVDASVHNHHDMICLLIQGCGIECSDMEPEEKVENIVENVEFSEGDEPLDESIEEVDVEMEPQAHGGELKRKYKVVYKGFEGKFSRIEEMRTRIPAFREFYLEKRFAPDGTKMSLVRLVDMFNEMTPPHDFFPQMNAYNRWRRDWDGELIGKFKSPELRLAAKKALEKRGGNNSIAHMLMKIKKEGSREVAEYMVPDAQQLEDGASTLGEMLLFDAAHTLKDTQDREEVYDDEVVVKRKMYALNVFNFVMRSAHKRHEIDIKRHGEARETAGFFVDLLARAQAGKLSTAELEVLKGSVRITPPKYANSLGSSDQ